MCNILQYIPTYLLINELFRNIGVCLPIAIHCYYRDRCLRFAADLLRQLSTYMICLVVLPIVRFILLLHFKP